MMKRTLISLILFSIFVVPSLLNYCKNYQPDVEFQSILFNDSFSPDDSHKLIAYADGYEGKIVDLHDLKIRDLLNDYYDGACRGGHPNLVLQCLENGADPSRGLIYAAMGGHPEIVKLLLAHPGIDVNKKDPNGITPLDLAERKGKNSECAELIRAAGGKHGSEL